MSDQDFRERVLSALERLDQKYDRLDQKFEQRFDSLETRLGLLEQGVSWIRGQLEGSAEIGRL